LAERKFPSKKERTSFPYDFSNKKLARAVRMPPKFMLREGYPFYDAAHFDFLVWQILHSS